MQDTDDVIVTRRGSAGLIRLNRPKALNSLTLPMIRSIAAALETFAADPAIAGVIVSGEGERGFCAGGDIRALHASGRAGTDEAAVFWREEFLLNRMISEYPKPYIALMDGIVMGGGVGLSAHGSHRIVTGRTRLAMPETGIGYFPDVGATWLLSRAPGQLGTWLGLTGLVVGAADALHAGLADYCVAAERLPDLVEWIAALLAGTTDEDVHAIISADTAIPAQGPLAANAELIDRCFAYDEVEEILAALAREPGDFAAETHAAVASRSPASLKLTLRLLRAGRASHSLAECLEREFGACLQMLQQPDFYEGIRAAVIDKDRNPAWSPSRVEDVDDAMIERFFRKPDKPLFASGRPSA
jgi:enoyl-CoA hydratase